MGYDERLSEMRSKLSERKHILSKIEYLKKRERELFDEVPILKAVMRLEAEDVEKLEGFTALSVLYTLMRKKDHMLEKEKAEAYAAAASYELASHELKTVGEEIEKCEARLCFLDNCEERYAELLKEKEQAVLEKSLPENREIERLALRIAELDEELREIEEAAAEGRRVIEITKEIVELLNAASDKLYDGWEIRIQNKIEGTTILNILAEDIRNTKVADNMLMSLPAQITRFKTELADIEISFNCELSDRCVLFSEGEIKRVGEEVKKTLRLLDEKKTDIEERRNRNQRKIEHLLGGISL